MKFYLEMVWSEIGIVVPWEIAGRPFFVVVIGGRKMDEIQLKCNPGAGCVLSFMLL